MQNAFTLKKCLVNKNRILVIMNAGGKLCILLCMLRRLESTLYHESLLKVLASCLTNNKERTALKQRKLSIGLLLISFGQLLHCFS